MKGIKSKFITDEETVRMHTNFAEFEKVIVAMASPDIATFSYGDGVVKVHTNTIHDWGVYVHCDIPKSLLKAGQKYGISVRVNNRAISISLMTADYSHRGTEIVRSHWDGDKISAVYMLKEADVVNGMGVQSYLSANNTDYELSDVRIWEIDDLGGAIFNILLIMLATTPRKEVAA